MKRGGHGDHWGCVFREVEEGTLLEAIRKVVGEDGEPESFGADGTAYRLRGKGLSMCVLARGDEVVSAYPEGAGGNVWPIIVRSLVPWANGVEGQIEAECSGAALSFFDTRFYANADKYRVGETYPFKMSAFAYVLDRGTDAEADTDLGTKVSFAGASAYMPANLGNEDADMDDVWFRSPLEGEAGEAMLAGKTMRVYTVTLAIPEYFEMTLPLYAGEHVLGAGMSMSEATANDVEGFLWLQGYMSEE